MNRQTIKTNHLQTISWLGDKVVDWACAGTTYSLNGQVEQLNKFHFAYSFDSAITSANGQYAFLYKRLGTKGLLIKEGEILREINRSYYHAETYEYPAAFVTDTNGTTFLIHCPISYCQLDFENVETGELVTNTPNRKPQDFFHSRLEVSPDNKYFVSKGWVWHPWEVIELFNVDACLTNPTLLDSGISIPNNSTEICSASFIDNDKLLVCSSQEEPLDDEKEQPVPPRHIAVWNFKTNKVSRAIQVNGEFGNLFAIDEQFCLDTFKFPKVINIQTGEIEDKIEELSTGLQNSSIIHGINETIPLMSYNRQLKKLAFKNNDKIEILSHK